jgi:hypothetical protein
MRNSYVSHFAVSVDSNGISYKQKDEYDSYLDGLILGRRTACAVEDSFLLLDSREQGRTHGSWLMAHGHRRD